ncbi:MAG: hypothetical protein QOH57_1803 [Mycobacterium sp.]|jgi:hypothetical protein|nr:hypothetical protein [Mycobacterium sp.]
MIQQPKAMFCWRTCLPTLPAFVMVAVLASGCSAVIGGKPVMQSDQAFFFAGNVSTYGQPVSADDTDALLYLRALRRIDVCGLLTGSTLAKVGELVSVGTTLAFDECDAEVKMSGAGARRFVALTLETAPRDPVSVCNVAVPLPLNRLPGAPKQPAAFKPAVRVELIVDTDCKVERRIGDGLAQRLAEPLPPRDAAAVYPARLAERDPCEVLSVLTGITAWDVAGSGPYRCRFALDGEGLQVRLQPRYADDGATECTAFEFVDADMQRRVIGGGYVSLGSVVIRPAVVVEDVDAHDCAAVAGVAAAAGKLYG